METKIEVSLSEIMLKGVISDIQTSDTAAFTMAILKGTSGRGHQTL